MLIDIHCHVRRKPYTINGKQINPAPEQLIARYDEINVEKGVILPLIGPEFFLPQSNEDVLEIAEQHPGRFVPFCNVHPGAFGNSPCAPLCDVLSYYKDKGCRGIGEVTANLPFLHPMMQNLFKHAQSAGLPVTFHMAAKIGGTYGIYDDAGLPQLERTLSAFPKLKFLAHSQVFWAEIARLENPADRQGYPKYPLKEEGAVPKLFRRYENLLGDLSANSGYNALARDEGYAAGFLDEFQDRLFFGLDICAPDTPTLLPGFLLKLKDEKRISETVFRKIARTNALKLLGTG